MNKEEIEQYELFKNKHLQQPISLLTKENLETLEQHCIRQLHRENGQILREHEIVLELIKRYKQLENKVKEQEELNNKYLQKLVYALSPTTHALGDYYNNAFKKIISKNIDLETCKIKRKLKECWGIDKKF